MDSGCDTPELSDPRSTVLGMHGNAVRAMSLSSATLETLTKPVSLKEQDELSKCKHSDVKQYLLSDMVVSSDFWTGIAQLRTLGSADILTSDEHEKKLTNHVDAYAKQNTASSWIIPVSTASSPTKQMPKKNRQQG